MEPEEFKKFFEPYSKNVDNADRLFFWKLSDDLILEIIKNNLPDNLGPENTILDAGGGTGRWIVKLSKFFKGRFVLYDLSEDMLRQAEKNIEEADIESRVGLVRGDLTNMHQIVDASIDCIVSIYNPISFIYEKEKVFKELFRALKPGGRIMIMGQGYYNAIASKINNYNAPAEEIRELEKNHFVKWGTDVPKLNVFSKESLDRELKNVGFSIIKTYGVPVFVQPGPEDFDPENIKKGVISKVLENSEFFEAVFNLEMKYNGRPELVNRGMNIFSVAQK